MAVGQRDLGYREAARRLARAAGVPVRSISYAGLKDRQALTRQWFSLHLPGKADPDLSRAEDASLRVLKQVRHQRKLQRGAHSANGFALRLTALTADHQAADARLAQLKQHGVPNYFGTQRFGHGGATSMTRSTGPPAKHYRAAQRAFAAASAGRSSTCSTRCWRHVSPKVAGRRPRSATCWRSPTAVASSRLARRKCADPRLAILDLHPDRPDVGWGATRLQAAPPRSWKMPSAHGSRHFAGGWRRRAWITNGVFCGSLLAA